MSATFTCSRRATFAVASLRGNDESIRKGRKMMRENHHHHHHHRRSCIGNENFTDRDFRRLCSSSSSSSRRGGGGKGAEERRRRRLSSLTASSSSPSSSSSQQKKYCVSTVDASAILVPHPDKSATGGEDSCFVLKRVERVRGIRRRRRVVRRRGKPSGVFRNVRV